MTNKQFVEKLLDIAENYKTLYIMGCFGAPMTVKNKQRYTTNLAYNKNEPRYSMILNASEDTFGFDCVCLVKGVLWGWNGQLDSSYGGAVYASNGVPDLSTEAMIQFCRDVSTNFSNIEVGELLWMQGHVGVYAGDGFVVECSPAWENKVQITGITGKTTRTTHLRTWTKHGKLPWIQYSKQPVEVKVVESADKIIWDFLKKAIGNDYGVAGLMGNLEAESGLSSINLENYYESKLHFNDVTYTNAVDSGTYTNFVNDCAGYGLAQWTYWSRKEKLYKYCKQCGTSIGDLNMQLEYLIQELQGNYKSVWNTLISATSVKQASDIVMVQFENPADQSDAAKNNRARLGQKWYDKYSTLEPVDIDKVYTGVVNDKVTTVLNIRSGPGTNFQIVGNLRCGTPVVIYEESGNWGRIQQGWVCLDYIDRT